MGRNSFSQDRELNSVALFKELVKKRSQGGVEIESIQRPQPSRAGHAIDWTPGTIFIPKHPRKSNVTLHRDVYASQDAIRSVSTGARVSNGGRYCNPSRSLSGNTSKPLLGTRGAKIPARIGTPNGSLGIERNGAKGGSIVNRPLWPTISAIESTSSYNSFVGALYL